MDFFEYQDRARRNSFWLIVLFTAAVAMTILALYFALAIILYFTVDGYALTWWQPGLLIFTVLVAVLLIGGGSGVKFLSLRQGGSAVATALGGVPVRFDTTDPGERRLINVVEEMAIASGTPVPSLYVLPQEEGINAFAAGHSMNNAAIGVTRGSLEQLSRDELQGVIAHEFSHIVNNDVRINMRLIGILAGILVISLAGRVLLRAAYFSGGTRRSSRDKGGGGVAAIVMVGAAMAVIGVVGLFFARAIKSAVSRQREYLADAAAVQFTRHPDGLAGALKKIGGFKEGSNVGHPRAEEASHMFFGDATAGSFISGIFSTHPPLINRIRRLDREFDDVLTDAERRAREEMFEPAAFFAAPPAPAHPAEGPARAAPSGPSETLEIDPALVREKVGRLSGSEIAYGREIIERLPPALRRSAHETLGALAIAYALLLDFEDEQHRDDQLNLLAERVEPGVYEEVLRTRESVSRLDRRFRLPLAELLVPALREMTEAQKDAFFNSVKALAHADDRLSIFEYAVLKVITHHLEASQQRRPAPRVRFKKTRDVAREAAVVVSGIAAASSDEQARQAAAYDAGMNVLDITDTQRSMYSFAWDRPFRELDAALDLLAEASPRVKANVIEACAYAALQDRVVSVSEAELLRAVSISIDCPIPPFLPRARVA